MTFEAERKEWERKNSRAENEEKKIETFEAVKEENANEELYCFFLNINLWTYLDEKLFKLLFVLRISIINKALQDAQKNLLELLSYKSSICFK